MEKQKSSRARTAMYTDIAVTQPEELLQFLLHSVPGKSRNNIKSLLKNREVMVDGCVETKHDYTLRPGQSIRIVGSVRRGAPSNSQVDILYEDEELIAINKPAGLLTMSTDTEREKTAYHIVTEYVSRMRRGARLYLVHRLDRDTSGVLFFAKNEELKLAFQDRWSELALSRDYVAVVEGSLTEKSGTLHSWLRQNSALNVYSDGDGIGREAVSNYQVIGEGTKYSLISIQLETGRKNQIRVQLKELGHPVAGDKKYAAATDPLKRLALHANKLELIHPFTQKRMSFEAPIPTSFKKLVK